jgi:hypothetical protein
VLDGVPTDCTFVSALALAGALTVSGQSRVAAGSSIAQGALDTSPCEALFNTAAMGGATPWSVFQNNVRITYNPETDSDTFASTSVSNGITTINFNTRAGSLFTNGSSPSAADTIIHELIHAILNLYGPAAIQGAVGLGWVNDDNTNNLAVDARSESINNGIVNSKCFPGQVYQ